MNNAGIHDSTRQAVATAVSIALIHGEESGVVTLLNNDESDGGLVVLIQGSAASYNAMLTQASKHPCIELTYP